MFKEKMQTRNHGSQSPLAPANRLSFYPFSQCIQVFCDRKGWVMATCNESARKRNTEPCLMDLYSCRKDNKHSTCGPYRVCAMWKKKDRTEWGEGRDYKIPPLNRIQHFSNSCNGWRREPHRDLGDRTFQAETSHFLYRSQNPLHSLPLVPEVQTMSE